MVPPKAHPPGAGKQPAAAMDVDAASNAGEEEGEGKKVGFPHGRRTLSIVAGVRAVVCCCGSGTRVS